MLLIFLHDFWKGTEELFVWDSEFLHVKPGKGAAFVRTKLRNYVTGNTVERTFRAGEQVCNYGKKYI
jgi:hypothetical protein